MSDTLAAVDCLAADSRFDEALALIDAWLADAGSPLDRKLRRSVDVVQMKRTDLVRSRRKWMEEKNNAEIDQGTYPDEEKGPIGPNDANKNLMVAIHKADKAIEEAISLRMKIMGQGERLMEFSERFDRMSEELPIVGRLIKKINVLDLRNQLILHAVFYVCLYCLITSAF